MEYLILNEESVPFESHKDANDKFPVFLKLIDIAFSQRIKLIRTTGKFDTGWFEFPLTHNLVLREWIETKAYDYKAKVKSIISKTSFPIIPDDEIRILRRYELSEFSLTDDNTVPVPSLGAALLLNQLAISFYSNEYWREARINIQHYEIAETTGEDEKTTNANVNNISTIENWGIHFEKIDKQRKESVRNGKELWDNRDDWFPNIVFCGETDNQLRAFSFSKGVKTKTWEVLEKLNDFCSENNNAGTFTISNLIEKTGLDISLESETVRNNSKLKQLREFRKPNGNKEYFEWHIKNISNIRLYFQLNITEAQIFVGYIGKHLPTKNY